jgi:hypothetical protein
VSPEIEIRNPALGGTLSEAAAAFETNAAYVAWRDGREFATGSIYAQKLGPDGGPLWAADGVAVHATPGRQSLPAITPDGAGGAVVVWLDDRDPVGSISAQRISASGEVLWGTNGLLVGPVYVESPRPFVHRGADGGFLVTWWDSAPFLSTTNLPVLAQKLDGNGVGLWDPGEPDANDLWGPGIEVVNGIVRGRSVPDGAGGLVGFGKIDDDGGFRFQRIGPDGSPVWSQPVDFTATLPETALFGFAADGEGGVVAAFVENRGLRTFRVGGDGTLSWGNAGLTLAATNVTIVDPPVVVTDGAGGAFVAWLTSFPHDVRVQHIAAGGAQLWSAEGAIVPDGTSTEREPAPVSDGAGGIFLSFTTVTSLRAQRLNSAGVAQWKTGTSNGLSLMSGVEPLIVARPSGPLVIYRQSAGLFARTITLPVADTFYLTNIARLPNNQVRMSLGGGLPGTTYDILRATALVTPLTNPAWVLTGSIQQAVPWIDTNPPLPNAFYSVRSRTP